MTWETVVDVLLDALKDSGLVLAFVFIFHVLLSFIEDKLSKFLTKNRKAAPIFGSIFGIIPQTIVADIALEDEVITGESRSGMFYAARTFAMKLGQSLAMLMFTSLATIGVAPFG